MKFTIFVSTFILSILCAGAKADTIPSSQSNLMIMDMVHDNPGEAPFDTKFSDPVYLKHFGYQTKVFFLNDAAQFGVNWQSFDTTIFPDGSKSRKWVEDKNDVLQQKYTEAKAARLKVYCELDMLVLPTSLVDKYYNLICTNDKIDINKPFTQLCFRSLMRQMFNRYPQMDGLIIRTGETYLFDEPYHRGNTPILNGMHDHVVLLRLLRDEVSVKQNKDLIYRTWDAGQFHSLPKYYHEVTDSIEPHEKLWFSIKHTIVDFWRNGITNPSLNYYNYNDYWIDDASDHGVYFNPCLGIGKHKQIVEVQCQREYEGKMAHPNYIAKGVIDGFAELKKPGLPQLNSLNEFKKNTRFSGVWTWSRGGGWGGPYITNEFWAELNAYVIVKWTHNPSRTEADIFKEFAASKGLPANEIPLFYSLCLLSDQGVMRGQWSNYGNINVGWTRDDNFQGTSSQRSYFKKMLDSGTVDDYLKEKAEALAIWKEIENLSKRLHFADDSLNHFVQVSCTYGRLKYQLFNAAWDIMLRGYVGDQTDTISQVLMEKYIATYDSTLSEWKALKQSNYDCPTIYSTSGFNSTINKYRNYTYPDILINFTAQKEFAHVKLEWLTSKKYHDHFEVQRSRDTINWHTFNTVAGDDTTYQANAYKAYDNKPFLGINYYRIKLYNTSGAVSVSGITSITIKAADYVTASSQNNNASLKVYPNPTKGDINFSLSNFKGKKINVILSDVFGKIFYKETKQANSLNAYTLQLTTKPVAGRYFLVVSGEQLSTSKEIIIQ